MRDLGVIVDAKLNYREHIDFISKKSSRLSGFVIRQTKFFNDNDIPIILFNCYVRSLLEYCCPIWSPSYTVHINRLERLQKRFIYHLTYSRKLCRHLESYDSRLKYFKMSTLEERRRITDVVFLHKLVNGIIDSPNLLERIKLIVPRSSSRLHCRKTFNLPYCHANYGHHSAVYRMCSFYNSICSKTDIFGSSVSSFKRLLYSENLFV